MKVVSRRKKGNTPRKSVEKRKKVKPRKVKIPLPPEDVKKLLKHAKDGREKRIITVMLETGMHPAVISEPETYDMELVREKQLAWHRTKTYALCVWDFERFNWTCDGDIKELVQDFIQNDVGYDRSTYWRDVGRVAKRAGLKYVSPLTLRHTATVELLRRHPIETVKQIIQCSDEALWTTYAQVKHLDRLGVSTTNKEDDLDHES